MVGSIFEFFPYPDSCHCSVLYDGPGSNGKASSSSNSFRASPLLLTASSSSSDDGPGLLINQNILLIAQLSITSCGCCLSGFCRPG